MRKRGVLLFLCLGLPATAAEPEPKLGERRTAAGRRDRRLRPALPYHDQGRIVDGSGRLRRLSRRAPVLADGSGKAKGKAADTGEARYNMRRARELTAEQIERVRGGGWDLPLLQNVVNQFVIHFDVCGTSRRCFEVLQDRRVLSVHFMLDIDGTIYQTLDLKERAWHATVANTRSVGIEIANIGAYPLERSQTPRQVVSARLRGAGPAADPGGAQAGRAGYLRQRAPADPGGEGRRHHPGPEAGPV